MPSSPGAVGRVPLGQHGRHLLDQSAAYHLVGARGDPLVQHRAGSGEYNVPGIDRSPGLGGGLPMRQRVTGEQRDLDRARRPLPAATAKSRIEPAGPAEQLQRLEPRGPRIQRAAPGRIERRLAKQTLRQRPHIESGSTDDDRQLAPVPDLARPSRAASRAKWPAL